MNGQKEEHRTLSANDSGHPTTFGRSKNKCDFFDFYLYFSKTLAPAVATNERENKASNNKQQKTKEKKNNLIENICAVKVRLFQFQNDLNSLNQVEFSLI